MELQFRALIDPSFSGPVPDAVAFETGATIADLSDPGKLCYEHHGPEFSPLSPGALTRFYEDLILGRPMPLDFAIRKVSDIDTVMAAALFLKRDLAIHPSAPGMVAGIDLVHRHGIACVGHLEGSLGLFLGLLRGYLPDRQGKQEAAEKLVKMVEWIHAYMLAGELPHLGMSWPEVHVLDHGTAGFVLAETRGDLMAGWVELYRQGFLRGLLIGPDVAGRRKVVASRKSAYVAFDLGKAAFILNGLEQAMGELPDWTVEGGWLRSPGDGTLILVSHILEVLLRV
jgi:hypothetical protein